VFSVSINTESWAAAPSSLNNHISLRS